MQPSIDLVVALWGVLAAGAAFVPLDSHLPPERLAWLLADAGAQCLLVHRATAGCLADAASPALTCLSIDDGFGGDLVAAHGPRPDGAASGLAYVMYTSGSTGQPKGVAMGHAAVVNKLRHPGAWGCVTPKTRGVLLGSIAFDAALAQIFLPLAHGGSLLLLDEEVRLAPQRFWAALRMADVTLLDATPSLLNALLCVSPSGVPLQRIVLGGEALGGALVRRLQALWPQAVVVNAYGPTEACIDAAAYEVPPVHEGETVPIGTALPNYRLYLLDDALVAVAPGVPAQLWIAGPGLADGYWRQPGLTAQRFRPDPYVPGERMYASGDRVRCNAQGQLEFLGRKDQQVKLRGQRIELEEIESVLLRGEGVQAAGVALQQTSGGERLLAALVLQPGRDEAATLAQVQSRSAAFLPGAMRPAAWRVVPTLPLTTNGKLDRRALAALAEAAPRHATGPGLLPQDDMTHGLLSIWSDLLGVPGLGVDDNFFEFGGDSLLAVSMVARVGQCLGVELPAEVAMSHPTVAGLAKALRQQQVSAAGRLLLRLNGPVGGESPPRGPALTWPGAAPTPLFCVPPLSGVGTVYAPLARALAGVCPVHAFHLGALDAGLSTPTMEALVAPLAAALQAAQPTGPVNLLGYSAGGAVAHRLAEQLQACGVPVARLFLVDPYSDADGNVGGEATDTSSGQASGASQDRFWTVCRDMVWEALGLKEEAADAMMAFARRWWQAGGPQRRADAACAAALQAQAATALPATISLATFSQLLLGADRLWQGYRAYQPTERARLASQVWLLQPDADSPSLRQQRRVLWQRRAEAALCVRSVPGEHHRMLLDRDSVQAIAACIRGAVCVPCLDDMPVAG